MRKANKGHVISRFFSWLSKFPRWVISLPGRLARWLIALPGRILRWSIRTFWAVLAWLRALPRRIWNALVALYNAVKDALVALGFAIVNAIVRAYDAFCAALARMFEPLIRAAKTKLDVDPAKIAASKLTLRQRGRKVAIFSRQLASMTQGGVGLLQALDVLSEQADDPRLAYVSSQLAAKLGQGYSFSKAASEYPRIFPPVFFHLLRAGESTGRLSEVIERLADLLEREENIVQRVRSALSYPIFVLVLTSILTLGLFSTVLPGFADFYRDFQVPLPMITAFLMKVTEFVQTPWFWIFLVLSVWGTVKFTKHSWAILERRLLMFHGLLWLPLIGPIIRYTCLARMCWVMELTQESGLDVVRSVKLGCLASGSPILEVESNRITQGITDGESLSELMLQRPEIHPHLLQQMVMMGEETSRNSESYGRAAAWFEDEVSSRIENFQAALEPILMGLISVVVGTIVLAVFLPLYGLLDKLGV